MLRFFLVFTLVLSFQMRAESQEFTLSGPSRPWDKVAPASAHAVAHAHGASSAAQAIAASQQAAMMFRLLMAKGVMDYFQRKEMDKANEVLSKKMERLQRELQAGKLSAAEFAAIKSAVEETYAKYSKMDVPTDKAVSADLPSSDKLSKSSGMDSSSGTLTAQDESGKSELQSGSLDLAKMDNQGSGFKNQNVKDTGVQDLSRGNLSNGLGSPNGLAPASGVAMLGNAQPPAQPSISIQNSIQNDSISKDKSQGAQMARELASSSALGMGFDGSPDFESEDGMIPVESVDVERDFDEHHSLLLERTPSQAQIGSSFYNLLKPLKFQKNPFSTKFQTEEGLHLGLLVLILGAAFVLGRGFSREKKIPRVIPEVVLTPEKRAHRRSGSVSLKPVPVSRRRTKRV